MRGFILYKNLQERGGTYLYASLLPPCKGGSAITPEECQDYTGLYRIMVPLPARFFIGLKMAAH
ncbi:MAG TPA: hypothetical protein PKD90_04330 [Phnomibacter sp.]|nr:hypothetical protein [Phnomibacter sp.]